MARFKHGQPECIAGIGRLVRRSVRSRATCPRTATSEEYPSEESAIPSEYALVNWLQESVPCVTCRSSSP